MHDTREHPRKKKKHEQHAKLTAQNNTIKMHQQPPHHHHQEWGERKYHSGRAVWCTRWHMTEERGARSRKRRSSTSRRYYIDATTEPRCWGSGCLFFPAVVEAPFPRSPWVCPPPRVLPLVVLLADSFLGWKVLVLAVVRSGGVVCSFAAPSASHCWCRVYKRFIFPG